MFVRVKTTPNSPRRSVQIVQSVRKGDKVSQKIVRHVGIAMDDNELEQLKQLAESIKSKLELENQNLLFSPEEFANMTSKPQKKSKQPSSKDFQVDLRDIVEEDRVIHGIHDIYGNLFDELEYTNVLPETKEISRYFRDIVLARIANPTSKRATVEMLEKRFGITLNLDKVYRMMDALDDTAIDRLQEMSYTNTCSLFQKKIDVIFFDCTTLYFETFEEDDFRKNGYSKDLKFNQPQVVLALLVTKEGLPIGYKAYEGNQYEGHTFIPVIQELREKYQLDKVVFVADAGMLSKENLREIESMKDQHIEYIIGARLKNLPHKLQQKILDKKNYHQTSDGMVGRFTYQGRHLIVSYSEKRAKKDQYDREKALEKLQHKIAKSKNPKQFLSQYGYKKYLTLEGESSFTINEEKIAESSQWDGLHGIITNCDTMSDKELLEQYNNLWNVEYAFRITKHDLKVRPVYHWKKKRVKAHLAISFAAYSLVRYLEYRVKLQYKKLSPERIRQALLEVQTSIIFDTKKKIRFGLPSSMSQDAKKIYEVLKIEYKTVPYIIKKM